MKEILIIKLIIMDLGGVVFKEPEITLYATLPPTLQEQLPLDWQPIRLFNRTFDFIQHVTQRDYKKDWYLVQCTELR